MPITNLFDKGKKMDIISYYCTISLLIAVCTIGLCCIDQVDPNEQQGTGQGNQIDLVEFKPGNDWEVLTTLVAKASHLPEYRSLHFFDANNGIAITLGSVHRTSDGGKTWEQVKGFAGKSFATLRFFSDNSGWIMGIENGQPFVLRTNTKGLSKDDWTEIPFAGESEDQFLKQLTSFFDVCRAPDGKLWFAGEGGVVGATLEKDKLKPFTAYQLDERMYSLACVDSGEVWSVGDKGSILRFKNVWQRIEKNGQNVFLKVRFDQDSVWILGMARPTDDQMPFYPILFKSNDSGKTWEDRSPGVSRELGDIWVKDGHIILIGARGSIVTSKDDGLSWCYRQAPTVHRLSTIYAINESTMWIGGDGLTILKKSR